MAKNKKEEEVKEAKVASPAQQALDYMKANKEDHFNFHASRNYSVSSGSLNMDIEMDGGLRPGILRNSGISEGGKTSNALSFMKNFLDEVTPRKRRGLYCKAEGRLSEKMMARSGVRFVTDPNEWVDGTCLIYKCNVFESVIGLIRNLVVTNPSDTEYFFIIDSMDSLIPRGDLEKQAEEAMKVAGGALLSTDFLRRMSIRLAECGHICVMISQLRSAIKINQYAPTDPKLTNSSGGHAANHYSDWMLEFQPKTSRKDFIWEGEEGKSERLGHWCEITFRKTTNEKTGKVIKYPIRYNRTNGSSVWVEREVVGKILEYSIATAKGSWIEIQEKDIKLAAEQGLELPAKIQGEEKFIKFLEENPQITEYFVKFFRNMLIPR